MPEGDLASFLPGPIPAPAREELEATLDETELLLGDALVRTHALGCDVLVEAAWVEDAGWSAKVGGAASTASSEQRRRRVERTLLFLHRPGLALPSFEIRPSRSLGERLLARATSVLGVPTLDLADHPEFAARHAVYTAQPDSVRALLPRATLDALAVLGDLRVKAGSRGVLVVRDERLDDAGRARLVEDARAACGAFVDDPTAAERAAAAVAGSYAEETAATLRAGRGLVGRAILAMVVTREMTESIRRQAAPRHEVPDPIARRAWRGMNFPILVVGGLAAGFMAMGLGLLATASPGTEERLVGAIFASLGVVAAVVVALLVRHRRIRRRILERGVVVEGVVESVEVTAVTVNNDRIHRVTLRLDGAADPVVVKVGSAEARAATRLQVAAARTWVLQDPLKTSRAIWCEGWLLSAGR